jgi:formylglycine-generating enzyme required for sulfatase activity
MSVAAFVHVDEPAGARRLAEPLGIGGQGARVIVPGVDAGEHLQLQFAGGQWTAQAAEQGRVAINAELLGTLARELRAGDVLTVGDERLVVTQIGDADLHLAVRHLAGNETVAPLRPPPSRLDRDDEDDIDIVAADVSSGAAAARSAAEGAARAASQPARGSRTRLVWWAAAAAAALALIFGLLTRLQRVPLDVQPSAARVRATDSVFSWQSGATLFALPGKHRLRAEHPGYAVLEREVSVVQGANETQLLRLDKLPGLIAIDTGGVAAEVSVDGERVGRAPGVVPVRPGARTFTLRADRYLDAIARLDVEGGGVRQNLKVPLRSSWGRLQVEVSTPGATVSADDQPNTAAPALLDLAAGVHRLRIAAAGAKTWESSVIVTAGQTTRVGPISLGAPDAVLALRSEPAGAAVTVSGVFKGRTPLTVPLPAGADYGIAVSRPGYAPWSRNLHAESAARLVLDAKLTPVLVALTVNGEPADAELFVDGSTRGKLPQTLQLTATSHAIEVRKAGLQTFASQVDLAAGVARTVDYRLVPEGRSADWQPPPPRVTGRLAGALRLVAPTSFMMGSERREQGRRPNETQRRVTFSRAFYVGVREVTNGEFRRFRADHKSGFIGKQSIDLDNQPVSSVSFDDAALYCNWLSKEEGLPEAYESKNGRFVLKQPLTTGYRLPTEAEWEYAARFTPQGLKRYEWGSSLPWPSGIANLAGAETGNASAEQLADHRDDYATVAPVGKYPPNALGLYDMTGNVSEWVNDRYSSFVDVGAATDPQGPDVGRATSVRGASWRTATTAGLRLAARESAEAARDDLGFRIARYAE